jgi:PAS domain S-box-containing protein
MGAKVIDLVLNPANYTLSPYAVPTFLTSTGLFVLGLVVLARERGSAISVLFHLLTLAVSTWLFSFSWMYCATDQRVALWWAKAAYLGVPFIPAAIYHFTVAVLGLYPPRRTAVWLTWTGSALTAVVAVGSDALISGLYRYWWGYYPRYGWFSALLLPFFFVLMAACMRHYWRAYRHSEGGARQQRIKWFMVAYGWALLASTDYLPKFGIPLYPLGWFPILSWLIMVERAIWRYRLVDITPAFAADNIIATMKNAVLVFDRDGVIRVANQAACELFKCGDADLAGRLIWSINPHFFPREQVTALIRSGTPFESEIACPMEPGRTAVLDVSASVINDRVGDPMAIVCIVRDVSAHHAANEALAVSEKRFRSIAQSASDAIISADSEGRIVFWNKGAELMFGYGAEEAAGCPLAILMPERYRDLHRQGLARLRETGESRVMGRAVELQGLRKDGAEFPVELSLAMWRAGNEIFYSGIVRDVSERKRAAQALHDSEERLRQAQKMEAVGRLAGGVAHDFNNLLTIIMGYSHVVMERLGAGHPLFGKIEEVKKAGDRAASLTQQLLAFSRKQVLAPRVIDLNGLAGNLTAMLRRLIGEHIELMTRFAPAVWPIKADPGQLEQVLMNLVVNARDAMPHGGRILIETGNVEIGELSPAVQGEIPPGSYVCMTVGDTGCGMDEETLSRIFEPFFTTKEAGKGTGLGLSTVYGIIEQSGGHITVSSELGKGTVFCIYLPRVDAVVEEKGVESSRVPSLSGKETILLVEDNATVRRLVRDMLATQGYRVMEAVSGIQAVEMWKEHGEQIALLVTDVVMPGVSGKELARRLRKLKPELKVMFISGNPDNPVAHRDLPEDGTILFQKPFVAETLARRAREVLDSP